MYYESENTFRVDGEPDSFAFARLEHANGDDARLNHLRHTTDFEEAKAELQRRAHGFLVVDTIQGSLTMADHDATVDARPLRGLERRAKELIALADAGYAVLVVSQTNDRNSKQPPTLGALKGASALEHMAWTVVGYGTRGRGDNQTRAAVLRKLRRPVAPGYPLGSRVLIRTDGQDRLTEIETTTAASAPPRAALSRAERVAAARRAYPGASVRQLATLADVRKTTVDRILKASPPPA